MQKTFVLIVHIINQMGQTIFELYDRVKAFDLQAELDKVIEASEAEIVDANTSQLMNGIDSTGKSLGEYKSKSYADYKLMKNPKGVVDLKNEGDFHSGFFIDDKHRLDSKDSKTGKLTSWYGEDIFGLTKENMSSITDDKLTPGITKAFQAVL